MINKIHELDTCQFLPSTVDLELLAALLQPEDETYPWDLADQESEPYFHQLEQQFEYDDLLGEDLTRRSQDFYQNLDKIWDQVYHSKTDRDEQPSKCIKSALHSVFAPSIPLSWLNTIAQKASEIINNVEQSTSEKLVECVQTLLPNLLTEDLFVLARRFEPAMRSNDQQKLAVIISNIENRDWTGLSEIEQAKVSLAIADYAFKELSNLQDES
ncbi:hypothetical protein SR1949_18200 [Sphaerospermopsis reniformis]|uniref:Uncharacterized protein n=1 Tax=Sphaerospermopsis reniformis TaxID=531300 RepID=A0A480A3F6_9CYAN|nr:hypothetical protein [Sphaerospermopsis reniformis]GCL36714.1 hypothetical protein SR1949_18200 [Sphaerospermopsis reniformis]